MNVFQRPQKTQIKSFGLGLSTGNQSTKNLQFVACVKWSFSPVWLLCHIVEVTRTP